MKSKNFLKFILAFVFTIAIIVLFTSKDTSGYVSIAIGVLPGGLPILDRRKGIAQEFKDALGATFEPGAYNFIPSEIRGAYALGVSTSEVVNGLFSQNQATLGGLSYLSNQLGTPGQLPLPEAFKVRGIKFGMITQTAGASGRFALDDTRDLIMKASWRFNISGKIEAEGSLFGLALPTVIWGGYTTAASTAENTAFNLIGSFPLEIPCFIPPGFSFDVQMAWTSLASGIPTSSYWSCLLYGIRATPVK